MFGVDVEVAESLEEQVPPPMWPMPRRLVPCPTEATTTIWDPFLHNGIITPRQELEHSILAFEDEERREHTRTRRG